jgi:hypothetical protein
MALSIEAQQQELKKRIVLAQRGANIYNLFVLPARLCHHRRPILCRQRLCCGPEELQISRDLSPRQKGNAKRRKHTLALNSKPTTLPSGR